MTHLPPTPAASVLLAAAGLLAALPYLRVNRIDVHRALSAAAPTYQQGQAALDHLAAYEREHGGDAWLYAYAKPRGRDDAAAELRAAAEQALAVTA